MKTIQLYEAGEGVSAALARINPGRGRPAMHPTIKGMDFALLPDESASKTPTQSLASRDDSGVSHSG